MNFKNLLLDKTWTLFLDRDGVINRRPVNDYVTQWDEFEFLPGVVRALSIFSSLFGKIIMVTNQQGIGKNLMTTEDLEIIHTKLLSKIKKAGGRMDAVYFCPDLENKPANCRKPGISMALKAKADFPEIDFNKSIMAGDTENDILFGKNAGMKTVLINTNGISVNENFADAVFPDLISFAESLGKENL
ncbi:MAG TPA: HAD-IIIA family hydrolase [Bacteroidetes bacterium]|nr:HAD-IIIA family hydrolase [Bacteroidota bacterium]